MNPTLRPPAWLLACLSCATLLHAEDHSVFRFKGANASETIEGVLVLDRTAVRTTTATGFSFAAPVAALNYTVKEGASVVVDFAFTSVNPNTATITNGGGGSTVFKLIVERVPSNPPFPGPPAFTMEFGFPGAAPWGGHLPDRTIIGAQGLQLGAHDLFTISVSVVEVESEFAAIEAELRRLEVAMGQIYKNPGFTLSGTSPADRVTALIMGIEQLGTGQRKQLYNALNTAP